LIKKIFVLSLLVFSLIPLQNAFAYTGGLLDKKPLQRGPDHLSSNRVITSVTDNNANTSESIGSNGSQYDTLWYEFAKETSIDGYYISSNGIFTLKFFNSSGSVIRSMNIPSGILKNDIPVVDKVKKISIENTTNVPVYISEFDLFNSHMITYSDVTSFAVSTKILSNTLTWKNPVDNKNFVGINIYRNGDLLKKLGGSEQSFEDTEVKEETNYSYTIKALYDDDSESAGVTKQIKTPRIPKAVDDVSSLKATTNYDRVNLSWSLPQTDQLKHVNIYRETLNEKVSIMLLAENESKKIFETNGTYFNDLTVSPTTTYEYTLTTNSKDDIESDGVSIRATTLEEPAPIISDGDLITDENGDYKFVWSEPTKGTVKIVVGGKEYATVNAADKQIIIPKKDMKYSKMGDPDVQAIPISESGKEGKPAKPKHGLTDMELPFGVTDLLKTGSGLLWWIAPFVLLGLAFLLVPKLRNLIINSVKRKKNEQITETERRTKSENSKIENTESDKPIREPREVKVRERQIMVAETRRERTLKEPRFNRLNRTSRETRQFSNRTREPREGRQPERAQRIPRELRKGR